MTQDAFGAQETREDDFSGVGGVSRAKDGVAFCSSLLDPGLVFCPGA